MSKIKITGIGPNNLKIEVDGKDMSEICNGVRIILGSDEMPLVEILLQPHEFHMDVENIDYIVSARDEYFLKLNALDRVTK